MAVTVERLIATLEAKIDKYEKNLQKAYGQTDRQFTRIEHRGKEMERRLAAVGATASGAFVKALGPLIAAGAAGALGRKFIDNTIEQQNAVRQLEAVLASTGGIAGVMSDAAQTLASNLQKVTTFGDEATLAAESLLLTFTKIGKDIFPEATETVLDMSTALGQGLKESAVQLGKALQDPVLGVTALRRVGVNFSDAQKSVIADLVKTGQTAKAQALILKELQTEFGGSARAARDTLGGALKALQNAFGDLFELSDPATEKLRQAIEELITTLEDPGAKNAMAALGGAIVSAFTTVVEEAKKVVSAIGEIETAFEHLSSSTGLSSFLDFVNMTSDAVDRLVQASADLGHYLGADVVGQMAGAKPYTAPFRIQDRIDGAFAGTGVPAGGNATEITVNRGTRAAADTTDYSATASTKKRRGSHRATADDRFAEDIQSIKDRTAALKEEQATLGMSFFEQQKRSVSLDLEQEALRKVRDEARRKGDQDWQNAQLTPDQVKQIDDVSDAYARQADSLRKAQEVQDLQRDVLKGAFSDLRSALADGKLDWKDLENVALNALERVTFDVFTLDLERIEP